MGYIYRSVTEVLVYLGDCIDRCEQTNVSQEPIPIIFHGNGCDSDNLDIFRLHSSDMKVRRLIKNIHSSHGCDFEVFCLIRMLAGHNHVTELLAKDTDLNVKGRITGLYELMRRLMHSLWSPWWNRIWVVQEIVVSRQVTMIYGKVSAPRTMFAKAASNLRKPCQLLLFKGG
jgi:hypothetical protein